MLQASAQYNTNCEFISMCLIKLIVLFLKKYFAYMITYIHILKKKLFVNFLSKNNYQLICFVQMIFFKHSNTHAIDFITTFTTSRFFNKDEKKITIKEFDSILFVCICDLIIQIHFWYNCQGSNVVAGQHRRCALMRSLSKTQN